MNCSLSRIVEIISPEFCSEFQDKSCNWNIETDSRHILFPDKTIFIAFSGTYHEGIQFIPDLLNKGVRYFIVDKYIENSDAIIFKVQDCLLAIQQLAAEHRKSFHIPMIGITGSNGKTIIKEWLSQLLSTKYNICKSPKSFNSQLGVSLSVLELKNFHDIGIFEAGISCAGEMERLLKIINPNIGILSNLGDAHDSGFDSRENKLKEKIKLFKNAEIFYYNGDQQFLAENLKGYPNAISWGHHPECKTNIQLDRRNDGSTLLQITHKEVHNEFKLPFVDEASIENIIPCIILSLDFKVPEEHIQFQIERLHRMKLRMEQKEGINGCIIINDSYSLDLKSLSLSIQFCANQYSAKPKVLVITDFPSNSTDNNSYSTLVHLITSYQYQTVIGIGDKIHEIKNKLSSSTNYFGFKSTDDLLRNLDTFSFKNQLILLKGARVFELERVFKELSLSNHESILEINLKSIAHNISIYKSLLNPSTEIIAVVKASAYGAGNFEIAHYIERLGINYFAVAYQEEAIQLRNKGIQSKIIVLNTGLAEFDELLDNNIEPAIFSLQQIKRLLKEEGNRSRIGIHIKLDTGMRRLGFMQEDIKELCSILGNNPLLKVISIFSHLSGSDSKEFDDFSRKQLTEFEYLYNQLTQTLGYYPLKHILNSGGISRHPEFQMDMVRLGIGMYGIDANPSIQKLLEKTHKLKTKVSQIKKIKASDLISYNNSGQLVDDGRIAILSIGYADGLPRMAGLQKYNVTIQGQKCALVGAVCMDMCMVDISHLKHIEEGEEVEVFGTSSGLEQLSQITGRIPYEIICGISHRVKRVFIEE